MVIITLSLLSFLPGDPIILAVRKSGSI